ncbi:PepSY domain-containing protein [Lacticigenium naphthae]|uniref:PepSY domain-containing protein n=1 Tax=Lacticigenium naphthae TaxID=515351 RepID=UPI0004078D1C|nr:PepSY domain-containing protein [Lacticigenium naphthae]
MIQTPKKFLAISASVLIGLGALLGWTGHYFYSTKKTINADDILKKVKKHFLEEGPIEGSWIELTKVPLRKFAYDTDVYYGGVSRLEESELVQYEFIADAYTGSIMDLYRV